ncbi:MAG: hypothetical protein NT150_13265 [Bacteroidetes bacterium]|nr:hypothetical protein [Bacteroidota bacterium]
MSAWCQMFKSAIVQYDLHIAQLDLPMRFMWPIAGNLPHSINNFDYDLDKYLDTLIGEYLGSPESFNEIELYSIIKIIDELFDQFERKADEIIYCSLDTINNDVWNKNLDEYKFTAWDLHRNLNKENYLKGIAASKVLWLQHTYQIRIVLGELIYKGPIGMDSWFLQKIICEDFRELEERTSLLLSKSNNEYTNEDKAFIRFCYELFKNDAEKETVLSKLKENTQYENPFPKTQR